MIETVAAAILWTARRDRLVVAAALALTAALGLWATLWTGDWLMQPAAPAFATAPHALLLFVMWWSMMLAMMLPTAAPALLSFNAIACKTAECATWLWLFAAGYAAIWSAFSLAAVILQLLTRDLAPLTGMMALTSRVLGGLLLIAAGAYQFTPLKNACLRQCQNPFFFLARRWRNGAAGAIRMGLAHGLHCLGCCWVLMLLLFYGGVMELTWILGLTLYVMAEKFAPARWKLDRIAGAVLMLWGSRVIWRALMPSPV